MQADGVCNGRNFSDHWVDGVFDQHLGAPLADARYDSATSSWSRAFASGTKVTFNALTKKGTVAWGSGGL